MCTINKIDLHDEYEDYERNVALLAKRNSELRKYAEQINDISNCSKYITDEYKISIDKKIEYFGITFDSKKIKKISMFI